MGPKFKAKWRRERRWERGQWRPEAEAGAAVEAAWAAVRPVGWQYEKNKNSLKHLALLR
jgi:hypothetical protein